MNFGTTYGRSNDGKGRPVAEVVIPLNLVPAVAVRQVVFAFSRII